MQKVLVTGANGLLGRNIVLDLLEQGYSVKALVRNLNSFLKISHENLVLIKGDITDYRSVDSHAIDCDYIIHSAANTSQNLLKVTDYDKTNYHGTKNIIRICKKNAIKKLVYVGTANTFGYGCLNDLGNEQKKIRYPFTKSNYAQSKLKAQELIDKSSSKIDVITISPTFMLGAYDSKPSSGKIVLMALNKNLVFYPSGGKNFIHVKDVSKATINALHTGNSGEKYLLSNVNMSYRDFFQLVSKVNNQKTIFIKIPKLLLITIGVIGEIIRKMGVKTDLSYANAIILTINNYYSNHKVKQKFKIDFLPIELAVEDAIKWFHENKEKNE